ncbi:MAG: hypothetical protein GEU73_13810 [Chloroflexi bacterium]|nr:hypothetical protein [Chloroflexota bacterium]
MVKADVASLYPSIMLAEQISPSRDELGAFLAVLDELTQLRLHHKAQARRTEESPERRSFHDAMQSAMKVLINSFYGSLGANFALFCDKAAAERVTRRGREILQLVLEELQRRGATLIEADTDGVLFSLPPRSEGHPWTYDDELALIEDVARAMPTGIHLEHDGRYRAMYSYREKNYALLDYEEQAPVGIQQREPIRLVGVAFRSTKAEALIERFLADALTLTLRGRYESVRTLYRETCARLRAGQVSVADLCVSMPLTKAVQTYAKAKRKEEPYEVWLAAGHTGWKPGQRISYYQAQGGKKRLHEPGATDYDAEHYIGRLRTTCKQRLEKAFSADDLEQLFSESDGLFDVPVGDIRPLCDTRLEPLAIEGEPAEGEETPDGE